MTARLTRLLGDFDLAEDLVQEAIVSAMEHWPREGIPDAPGAWLLTVAKRKGLDRLRRATRYREKLAILGEEAARTAVDPTDVRDGAMATTDTDDRLELIFTCCHPALSREAQVALTLRSVTGLTTPEIARAFLIPEATLAQRIVRAKRKIVEAGISFKAPEPRDLAERLSEVLAVLVAGPEHALREVDAIAEDLDRYHLLHATRAELLRDLGRPDEARDADRRALELTENPAERALLEGRIARS